MESTILSTIKARLNSELNLEQKLIDDFVDILKTYMHGDYLYYEYFRTELGIIDEDFVLITNVLIRMGLAEKVYKLFCPNCGEISRTLYTDIKEIRTADLCEKCDSELVGADESYKYIVVFFRLVNSNEC